MASQPAQFYAEDLVRLQKDKSILGVVESTHGDVSTHYPVNLARHEGGHIKYGEGVSVRDYHAFLREGIPPRNTVCVLCK